MPFTRQSQARWLELILAVSDLVRQASLASKRINFTQEISTYNANQDVTSLLDAMWQRTFTVRAITGDFRGLEHRAAGRWIPWHFDHCSFFFDWLLTLY